MTAVTSFNYLGSYLSNFDSKGNDGKNREVCQCFEERQFDVVEPRRRWSFVESEDEVTVKITLRSAARPRRALAFHLRHSRVTCTSLQLHLLFTCSSPIDMSFTCGSLDQQSVLWRRNNWLISAWRPAQMKLNLWFPAKALLPLVLLNSLQCLSFPSLDSSQTPPGHSPFFWSSLCDQWLNKEGPHSCTC